jgi:hypothetical protein
MELHKAWRIHGEIRISSPMAAPVWCLCESIGFTRFIWYEPVWKTIWKLKIPSKKIFL